MKWICVLAALALAALSVLVATPLAADAATLGPGYEYRGEAGSHIGGYADPDGTVSYCINAGAPSAVGKVTTDAGVVDSVNGLDPDTMVRLNEVLSAHGNTSDDNTAAAVAMAVWSIAGPAAYNAEGGDRYVLGRAPAAQRATIQALANQFRDEAAAWTAPTGSATLTLGVDPTNTAKGTLTVATTGSGRVTLTNAVFTDTGLPTRDGVTDGAVLAITGAPPGPDPYRVSVAAVFTGAAAPSADVHVYTTPGSQTLTASGTSSPITFQANSTDTADRLVPTISTTAQPSATVGGTVIDTVHATAVPTAGEQIEWNAYLQTADAAAAACTAATLVFSSTLTITADGDYSSEPFALAEADIGRILWVATATVGGAAVATGSCGDTEEISVISPRAHLPVVSG
jgi:hypothetical protein